MSLTFWSIENVVNLFKFVYSFWKSKIIILKNNKSPLFVINFLPLKMFPQRQLSEDTKECHTDCLAWYSSDSEDDFVVESSSRRRKEKQVAALIICFIIKKLFVTAIITTSTSNPYPNHYSISEPGASAVDCGVKGILRLCAYSVSFGCLILGGIKETTQSLTSWSRSFHFTTPCGVTKGEMEGSWSAR